MRNYPGLVYKILDPDWQVAVQNDAEVHQVLRDNPLDPLAYTDLMHKPEGLL